MPEPKATSLSTRLAVAVFVVFGITAAVSYALKPTEYLSAQKAKIDLASQIPVKFADWQEDTSITPVLPNPQVQASLDVLYSSTLARTYRNSIGQRIMLSVAYGSDQSSEATAVHRPEFCYSAQGFKVTNLGFSNVPVGQRNIKIQHLLGVLGQRYEPISYWITMDETATLPGLSRKLTQIRYGLQNKIPDGMLFRLSTVGMKQDESFALQQRFLSDLAANMEPSIVSRYFGT
jgi:EpsI family protein